MKVQQGHGGGNFEERGPRLARCCAAIESLNGRPEQIDQGNEFFGLAGLAVHGHALFDPLEVRRREQAGSLSGGR